MAALKGVPLSISHLIPQPRTPGCTSTKNRTETRQKKTTMLEMSVISLLPLLPAVIYNLIEDKHINTVMDNIFPDMSFTHDALCW